MFAISGFVSGPEASFRFTDVGWQWVNDPANPYALRPESRLTCPACVTPPPCLSNGLNAAPIRP
jgi:hypothetical protein